MDGVTASEFTRWGFGVAQEIDKAATTLWLKYRRHDGELDGGPFAGALDAFRYVSTGAIINLIVLELPDGAASGTNESAISGLLPRKFLFVNQNVRLVAGACNHRELTLPPVPI